MTKRTSGYRDKDGVWHHQCPRCGHNYFNGGSGHCRWCIKELKEEDKKFILEDNTKFISCIKLDK